MIEYKENPDIVLNSNGRMLRDFLTRFKNLFIVNGLITNTQNFDSDFTFIRGSHKSQVDWCITNNLDIIMDFKILPLTYVSDHKPLLLDLKIMLNPSLEILFESSYSFRSYVHYDINRRLKRPIKMSNINQ